MIPGDATTHRRIDLVENLLAHRTEPSVPLIAELDAIGGFMRVLEAVRTAPEPRQIDASHIEWRSDTKGQYPVVANIAHWIDRVANELATFSELGAPWTRDA